MILHIGDRFRRVEEGTSTPQPRAFLVGQMTGPLSIQAEGAVDVLGVRFKPGGLAPFVRLSLDELTGRAPALEEIWGDESRGLIERMAACGSDSDRIAQVELHLALLFECAGRTDRPIEAMTAAILAASGRVRVAWLAEASGLSARQLERRFLARVGIGPKMLCRIARFQSTLAALSARPRDDWASLAVDCGYFDQSHLIGEFKAFSGMTPASWSAQRHPLSDLFTG